LPYDKDYEKTAHLYDLFDTKENTEFFLRYASGAGEETVPLSLVLSHKGRGKHNSRGGGILRLMSMHQSNHGG